ncbi:MAG: tetratricopeptide repeat protein [Opitutaceae bacterium]|nr:tetratricopeptide repeat protein [Opitutaceae bacterium]
MARAQATPRGGLPAWIAAAVIVAAVGAALHAVVNGQFLSWDDDINLTANPHLRELSAENLRWIFTDATYMRRYVPFAWLGWAVEQRIFGLSPVVAHAGNLILHALNAVLVFFVVRRLMRAARPAAEERIAWAALAAALVWALHPLRVEIVAWASGRMYAQGMAGALLGVLAYLRAVEIAPGGRGRRRWLAAALAAFAFSFLSYPVFVPVVAVLAVMDFFPLRRFEPAVPLWRGSRNRAVWTEKIPFLALAGAVALITIVARARAQGIWAPPPTLAEFGLFERIAQAGYVWAYYVWKPLVPTGLAPVYTTLVEFDPRGAVFIASLAGVAGATVLLWWRRTRWPAAWALWLAHLILIAPMLGLAESPHYANDRYAYFQGLLWSLVAAWLIVLAGRAALIATGVAVVALGVLSARQVPMWRDSETLFRRLYQHVGPTEYRADIAMRLGDVLRMQGRFGEAKPFFADSLRIQPNVPRAAVSHTGLARIMAAEGKAHEALEHYKEALRLDPAFSPAWVGLGELLVGAANWSEAVPVLERAVALQGGDAAVRDLLGAALVQVGRPAEAVVQFEASLRLRPRTIGTICNLVVALSDAGRREEAVALARDVAQRAPGAAQAHYALGHALRAAGKNDEAITAFAKALEIQPDHAVAREALVRLRTP